MELKLQVAVQLLQEIARDGVKPGSRKINGKYIHSHLVLMLEDQSASSSDLHNFGILEQTSSMSWNIFVKLRSEIHNQLFLQIEDVNAIHLREIPVEWQS